MLIPFLVFLAVSSLLAGLYLWLVPTRTEQRLQALSGETGDAQWRQTAVRLAAPLARLSAPLSDWDSSPLRVQFFNAGIRHDNARLVYYAAKTVLPLALAGAAYLALTVFTQFTGQKLLLCVATAALVGIYLPNAVLWWLVSERQREIFETFPDAADLMLVCVEAGLGLDEDALPFGTGTSTAASPHADSHVELQSDAPPEPVQAVRARPRLPAPGNW